MSSERWARGWARAVVVVVLAVSSAEAQVGTTRPATRPATRPTTRASAAPSAELLALWKEIEPQRQEAVTLARAVTKGMPMETAKVNRRALIGKTKQLNALLEPVARASPLRYGATVMPASGIGKAIWLYKAARAVENYNLGKRAEMTEQEWDVFVLVNQYREALGLLPLEYDLRLRDSARGHTQWMREHDVFAHEVDRPGGRNHGERMSHEGYTWTSAGENIAFGQQTGLEVFWGWFESPGHHHTMVGDYIHLGVGVSGTYWCQNFGKGEKVQAAKN